MLLGVMDMNAAHRKAFSKRVLDFWFGGELPNTRPLENRFANLWFGADAAVDGQLRTSFLADLERVEKNTDGIYDSLTEEPTVSHHSPSHLTAERTGRSDLVGPV